MTFKIKDRQGYLDTLKFIQQCGETIHFLEYKKTFDGLSKEEQVSLDSTKTRLERLRNQKWEFENDETRK